MEKNDTYQDQHIQVHQKSIDELNKLIKSFAVKLNQLKSKGDTKEGDSGVKDIPIMLDNDLTDVLADRIAALEE